MDGCFVQNETTTSEVLSYLGSGKPKIGALSLYLITLANSLNFELRRKFEGIKFLDLCKLLKKPRYKTCT